VAIKDDLEVAGLRFTCGSRLRAKEIGKSDDLTVARPRKAGAIILGETNEPEFRHKGVTENKLFGTTPTPWHPERTAGGSSGGSAAAVAAGLAYLALGTDIAGSVRIPASCCGIAGLKPSFGRIPRARLWPCASWPAPKIATRSPSRPWTWTISRSRATSAACG
jgi:Asp-tRNA(Asn)/Glu-tRNA(Gln) amidotransferase A subunit family amidase